MQGFHDKSANMIANFFELKKQNLKIEFFKKLRISDNLNYSIEMEENKEDIVEEKGTTSNFEDQFDEFVDIKETSIKQSKSTPLNDNINPSEKLLNQKSIIFNKGIKNKESNESNLQEKLSFILKEESNNQFEIFSVFIFI